MTHASYQLLAIAIAWAAPVVPLRLDELLDKRDDRLLLICWNEKCGFIDRLGRVVVQGKYDEVNATDSSYAYSPDAIARRSFSEGIRPVKLGEKWGYIDPEERFVIAARFDRAGPFRDGRAQVLLHGNWGVIDRRGEITVEPRYSYIATFQDGWAPVAVGGNRVEGGLPGGKWGLLDATGKIIAETKYDMVYEVGKDIALVNIGGSWDVNETFAFSGGKWGIVNRQGKLLTEPSFSLPSQAELEPPRNEDDVFGWSSFLVFSAGLAPVSVRGKWGYLDESGRMAVKPQFDWCGSFTAGPLQGGSLRLHRYAPRWGPRAGGASSLARARLDGKFGFVDRGGAWAIKPAFDRAGYFSEGLAWATKGTRCVFLNERGAEAFAVAKAEEAIGFWHGLAAVRVGEKWGYVDRTGAWVYAPQFDAVRQWSDNLQQVTKDGKQGLIDRTGKLVCPIKYDWFGAFQSSRRALVGIGPTGDDADIGLIDESGRVILEPAPGRRFDIVEGKITGDEKIFPRRVKGQWGFVDRTGAFVIEPRYEACDALGEGMASARDMGQQGLVDLRTGKLVCPPKYYSIGRFSEGLAEVQAKFPGKRGFLDRTGTVVIPPTWDAVGAFRDGVAWVNLYGPRNRPQLLWIDRSGKYLWTPPER